MLKPDKEGTNESIHRIVRQSRKTVGFSPISQRDIKEIMIEMRIENIKEGLEEVIKDFLRWEMAIPEDEISKIQFARIFRREGDINPNDDKLYVEFVEESMPAIIYKYLKKMRSRCNVLTFIPEAFRERAMVLEKAAYNLRHSDPKYNIKIRWGWGDLILERKMRGSREQFRPVHMTHLPPVDLTATPRERPNTPTSSPAPGRKVRKKRARSEESVNLSPIHKVCREDKQQEKTTETAPMSAPPSRMDAGFFSPINFVTPKGSSQPSNIAQPDFQ